ADFPRTVAVTGMGGLGKTQLAVEFCFRYGRYFPGGVFWLSFADAENVANEVVAIGGERGMGLYKDGDQLSQADQIGRIRKAWQEPIPRLLIFDNCEEESLLSEWIPVTGGCRVLLTSRRAHWSRPLQVVERPLPLLDSTESVALFKQLAPHLKPEEAADIANELGRLPLALNLAGSFLSRYGQVTAVNYLSQLRSHSILQHPSLQGRGSDYSPTGHELNVYRTFAFNLVQLDIDNETDAHALYLLACAAQFAPGEPIPRQMFLDINSQTDDLHAILLADDALTRLATLGFIQMDGQQTITIHRLLVSFANNVLENVTSAQQSVEQVVWQKVWDVWEKETTWEILPIAAKHLHHIVDAAIIRADVWAARLAHTWGRHLLALTDFEACSDYLGKSLTIFEENGYGQHPDLADLLMALGTLKWSHVSDDAAWPYYKRANEIYKQSLGSTHRKTARSLNNLGILHSRTGNPEMAKNHYERALSIYEQIDDLNPAEIARTLYNLGQVYKRIGDFDRATVYHERANAIRKEIVSEDNLYLLQSLNSLGVICYITGNYERALAYFKQTLVAYQEKFGKTHIRTASAFSNIGTVLLLMEQHEAAMEMLTQALGVREKLYASDNPNVGRSLSKLGHLYLKIGKYAEAQAYLEKALQIQLAAQPEHNNTADTLNHLADLHIRRGELEAARPFLEQA
ncbi:MAG: tetratricopeptide repeat protein, partial [Chloroflexi bacterium]|nr:tetratricopeptide repeat protein [Chloroflexota bacterium]